MTINNTDLIETFFADSVMGPTDKANIREPFFQW